MVEFDLLKKWELDGIVGIDYWDSLKTKGSSQVMVAPEVQAEYEAFLLEHAIEYSLLIEDVEE
jgi:hypothetical protein